MSTYSKLPTADWDEGSLGGRGGGRGEGGGGGRGGRMLELRQKEKEQDKNLDSLSVSVSRLGDLSLTISREIDLQNRMLDELEHETDSAKDKADILTKKTSELINKAGGTKNFWLIVSLIIILFVLIILVIYT